MSAKYQSAGPLDWAPIDSDHVPDPVKELLDPVHIQSVTIHAAHEYPTRYRRNKP